MLAKTITPMPIRRRLSQEESRTVALVAARNLLIEMGPQAVTLKAVASRIGRTHANLLHHFGSASGLQKALAQHLAGTICKTIAEAVLASRAGIGSPREVVDLTFDAFDREGGGALASWMLLSGNEDALDPIVDAIHDLVDELHDTRSGRHARSDPGAGADGAGRRADGRAAVAFARAAAHLGARHRRAAAGRSYRKGPA